MPTRITVSADYHENVLTAEDFLEWLVPGRHADLIDGTIVMHSPVSLRHAQLLNFVDHLIRSYVEEHELGQVFREVVAVRLSARNVYMPDLAFYRRDRLHLLREAVIDGAPDPVVEVLSDLTADRDRGTKFIEYEEQQVGEYWMLDPRTGIHNFFRHNGEIYEEFAHDEASIPSQVVPGLVVQRGWLDPDNLPKVSDCMEQMGS